MYPERGKGIKAVFLDKEERTSNTVEFLQSRRSKAIKRKGPVVDGGKS